MIILSRWCIGIPTRISSYLLQSVMYGHQTSFSIEWRRLREGRTASRFVIKTTIT